MMSLQELSDRREIDDLLIRYCHAIDTHDWALLDTVFMPDSVIDYTVFGGPRGRYPEIREFLADSLPRQAHSQHVISTSRVLLDGDRATASTICTNPMGVPQPDGSVHHTTYHLWYIDEIVRTPAGWRLAARTEKVSHQDNPPPPAPGG